MPKKADWHAEYIDVSGEQQYLLHYPANGEKPLLLFLHGGPGMAESVFAYAFQDGLADYFSTVYWDQRGAGKTLAKSSCRSSYPTVEELLGDMRIVVGYLKQTYKKQKVAILGHSWGSMLGTLFAQKYPEEVECYIGAGQIIDILENERHGYNKLKEMIHKANNRKDLERLARIGEYPEAAYSKEMIKKIQQIRILQGKYRLGMDFKPVIKALLRSPVFRLPDILSLVRGMSNNKPVWNYLFSHTLLHAVPAYEVPVFYILGDRDFQAPQPIASQYFDSVQAPAKKKYIIQDAGHFMMLDQPAAYREILAEISVLIRKLGEGN